MIRAIRDWLSYRAMRARWTHEDGAWIAGDWRIELVTKGLSWDPHDQWSGYRVTCKGSQLGSLHPSLRRAMEAAERKARIMLSRRDTSTLGSIADFLLADARAEHEQVGRPNLTEDHNDG